MFINLDVYYIIGNLIGLINSNAMLQKSKAIQEIARNTSRPLN
jgi:hypothetical protein